MNNNLISRSALLERLKKVMVTADAFGMGIQMGVHHAEEVIKEAPTVDPTPVGYKMSSTTGRDRMMCSKCLKDITEDAVFCKYCGAKMEGDLK